MRPSPALVALCARANANGRKVGRASRKQEKERESKRLVVLQHLPTTTPPPPTVVPSAVVLVRGTVLAYGLVGVL